MNRKRTQRSQREFKFLVAFVLGHHVPMVGGQSEISNLKSQISNPMTTPLQTELSKPAYAGLSDADAAAALNAPVVAGFQMVECAAISILLIHSGELPAVGAKALLPADPAFPIAYTVVEYIRTHQQVTFDPSTADGAKAVAMLAATVEAGLISAASQTAILAMANRTTTRARQLGYGVLSAAAVTKARAGS
jgi:hypothetical protein